MWMVTILFALSAWLLAGCPAALAQSIFANLSGTVVDPSGAAVSGAKVDVKNESTNVVRHLVSNSTGFFSVTELPTGSYSVTVLAEGFEKWVGTGIVLQSTDDKTLSIPLKIGSEGVTVEVKASSNEFAVTDSGAKAEHIDAEDLQKLALVGRNAMEFLKTIPGAAQVSAGGTNRSAYSGQAIGINGFTVNGSAGGMSGVSINGQTGVGLSMNMDGQNVEDPGGPGSATPVNPNPDMISEVTVQASNFSADNAKGPIVINSVSKSGGSSFHGGAAFYARNAALNTEEAFSKANEATTGSGFTKGQLKVPSHYYYPGFNIGGPIIIPGTHVNAGRNKYFFHESFESYRQLIDGGIDRAFVPTAAAFNGDFSAMNANAARTGAVISRSYSFGKVNDLTGTDPTNSIEKARPGCVITGGVMNSSCISSAAQLWMQDSLPAATTTNGVTSANGFNYTAPVQQPQNSTHNMVKVDINLTDSTKAYVSWSRQREASVQPLGLWIGSGDNVIPSPTPDLSNNTSDFYTADLVHVFTPTLTVEGRFGYTHMDMPGGPQDPTKVLRKQMGFPLKGVFGNQNAPVATSWSGGIPNIGDIGHDYHPNFYAEKGIPSAGGDLTKVFKTHTVKFGAFWENMYNAQDAWSQYMGAFYYNGWGNMSGNSYSDLLMGVGFSYTEQPYVTAIKMSINQMSFYGQDHWKLNRRITVDYGLRLEHYGTSTPDTPFGDAVFNPAKYAAQYAAGAFDPGVSWHSLDKSISLAGASVTYLVYSPRLGASIDVFGTGKTVVRGGWGEFRNDGYAVANQGAANTAYGSFYWSPPGTANTWESIDQFANNGGANGTSSTCAANAAGGVDVGKNNCAPALVTYGKQGNFANTGFAAVDPTDHDQPYTTSYSLTIDQQLPGKFQLEVGYVGSHSTMGQQSININYVPVNTLNNPANITTSAAGLSAGQTAVPQLILCSTMDAGSYSATNPLAVLTAQQNDGGCQQKFRPYSDYQGISANESAKIGQYDSFQASLKRSSGWATIGLNYTFGKTLNNATSQPGFKDYGEKEYWSVDGGDRGQTFNATYVFDFPKLTHGSNFDHALLNNWELSGITQVMSGAQMAAAASGGANLANGPGAASFVGSPDTSIYAALTCNPKKGLAKGQFANPNCFALPTSGIGNGRYPYIAGPMFWSSDLSLLKKFKVSDHEDLNFRLAAFNPLNHALLSFVSNDNNAKASFDSTGALSNGPNNPSNHTGPCPGPTCTVFGYADAHYGYRIIELSAKFNF